MKQLIKTTILKGLRPLFNSQTESIQRFFELKDFFGANDSYKIFAEPTLTKENNEIAIDWQTEFEGDIIAYSSLSEQDKEMAKGLLKRQINQLYNFVYFAATDSKNRSRVISILENAIEIPEIKDIYLIKGPQHQLRIVLTRWGFIYAMFNAENGIIRKLVPIKVKDLSFKFIYQNKEIAPNEKIIFSFDGKDLPITSDANGKILLYDIGFNNKIDIFQLENSGNKKLVSSVSCDINDEHVITINNPKINAPMQFSVLDEYGKHAPGAVFIFEYAGKKQTITADSNGKILLTEIKHKQAVFCYQLHENKQLSKHNFTFDRDNNNYELIIETPPLPEPIPEPILISEPPKMADVKQINVIYPNNTPVSQAKTIFRTSQGKQVLHCDTQGLLAFTPQQYNQPVPITIKKGWYKTSHQISFSEEQKEYTLILKKRKPWWFWLLLLLIILGIAALLCYYLIFLPGKNKPVVIPSNPIANVEIEVIDKITNQKIKKALVKINTEGLNYNSSQVTNASGTVKFNNVPISNTSKLSVYVNAPDYEKAQEEIETHGNKTIKHKIYLLSIKDGGMLGETGDLRINLKWNTEDDLDLYVTDPCGTKIYYGNRRSYCKGKTGMLDLDANGSTAPALTNKPQENIYWTKGVPGMYSIFVENNRKRTTKAVKFTVTIKNRNSIKRFEKFASTERQLISIATISFN